jgi:hypothetical protein
MDYREKNFKEKFKSASQFFNCDIEDIASLKLRDVVNSHDYYTKFAETFERNNNIPVQPLKGNYQGNAFSISAYQTNIIYVEHESGLEILYIAGSIASLIGLIPAIIQIWNFVRNKNDYFGRESIERIETRYFDKKGKLIEEHNSQYDNHSTLKLLPLLNRGLDKYSFPGKRLDNEIEKLKRDY